MNTPTIHKSVKVDKTQTPPSFFPRVIREFEDDDEPMVYGATRNGSR